MPIERGSVVRLRYDLRDGDGHALEDEGTEYRRIVVAAETGSETVVDAFAYEYLLPLDRCPFVGPRWTDPAP